MRDDLAFNIRFVELIESKPCLYDYNRPDYCNRNAQDAAWNEISKTIKEPVNDCKERWKNIRGSFTKYLNKKVPSGSSSKPTKPYYLAENLRFSQPFTKSRKSLGNTKEVEDTNSANEIVSSESDSELDAALTRIDAYAEKSSSEAFHIPKKKKETKKHPSLAEVNSSAFEYFQKKHSKLQECSEKNTEDADKAFLISVVPDMKKMTDNQKRKFKIGILNLAEEILEGNRSSGSSVTVHPIFSPHSESSPSTSNMRQVYSPISLASPNPSTDENIIRSYHPLQTPPLATGSELRSYHSLQRPHLATDLEYTTSFPTQQHSFD